MANLSEAIERITRAGRDNVVIEQESGGQFRIKVLQGGTWVVVVSGITRQIAEDIVNRATNRTLLG